MSKKQKTAVLIAVLSIVFAVAYGARYEIGLADQDPYKEQRALKEQYRDAVSAILTDMPKGDFVWLPFDDVQPYNKTQNVFKGATSTDVVLLFEADGRVIVYSPTRKKIVNVSPLVIYQQPETPAQAN